MGEHTLSAEKDCLKDSRPQVCAPPVQNFDIEKIIPHESYNSPNPFQNDIALVRLDRDVEENGEELILSFWLRNFTDVSNYSILTSDYVQPICLPFADEEEEAYTSLTSQKIETVVAGWGATEQLGTYDLVYA